MTATAQLEHPVARIVQRLPMAVARVTAVAAATWVGFVLLIDDWRAAEASVVVNTLDALGITGATRFGAQIDVERANGASFLANIGPLCSSLGVVLLMSAIAIFAVRGSRRRRAAAVLRGAGVVIVCNLLRIGGTVVTGLRNGTVALDAFHDGLATAFAVLFVLGGFALFAFSLPKLNDERRVRPPSWQPPGQP
ncbi:hypothetical protein BH10ACT2_BH10ACT2_25620 [soil metagenome]